MHTLTLAFFILIAPLVIVSITKTCNKEDYNSTLL